MWQKYFFMSRIPHKEENKLPPNAKIQETDPLYWFHFDSLRDVFWTLHTDDFPLQFIFI